MYVRDIEKENREPLSSKYNVYEAPYTKSKKVIGEWGYYVTTTIMDMDKNYVRTFGKIDSDTPIIANPLVSFIQRLTSFYDNTWSGGSLDYMNKLYGNDQVLPTRFINYPLMRGKIEWLVGRFEGAPIDMHMGAIDEKSVEDKVNKATQKLFLKLMLPFIENLEQITKIELEPDKTIPEDIDKWSRITYKQAHEIIMSKLTEYNFKKYSWMNELTKGFRDTALYGFSFLSHVPINDEDIKLRKPNLNNVVFDWGCENDYGEDAMYYGERRYMTLSEIQREFVVEKQYLDEIRKEVFRSEGVTTDPYTLTHGFTTEIEVIDLLHKASTIKKVKKTPNKYIPGKYIYKILAEGEEIPESKLKKEGSQIVEIEKFDWYRSVLVANKVVVKCEPVYSPRKNEQLTDVVQPFTAFLYNRINSYKPNGFGELMEAAQELFNACMALLELELATSPGNVVEYDTRFKPKNVPLTNVFYHMRANKLIQVDRSKAGSNAGTMFNQVNLTPNGATIYLNVAMYVENFMDRLTGISSLAQGNVPQDTFVGTLQTAIEQSNFITKPLYTFYREGIRKTFKNCSCYIKEMNKGKKRRLALVAPDAAIQYFAIEGDIAFSDYDFFYNDGMEDEQKRQMLINLGQNGLSAGTVTFKTLKDLIMTKNITEVSVMIDQELEKFEQRQQQMQQIQQQLENAKMMQPQELARLKGEIEMLIKQQVGQTNKEVAQIYAQEKMKDRILEHELKKGENL